MVDTPRLQAALLALYADNVIGDISAQDGRDFIVSATPTGRPFSKVVAASGASDFIKASADYVCDGTADDVEINAAIAALPSTGGVVLLTPGTFNTVDAITWTVKPGVHLRGSGVGATVIAFAGADLENCIFLDYQADQGMVSDMTVDGTASARCQGIRVYGTTGVVLQDVLVKNFKGRADTSGGAIDMSSSYHGRVLRVRAEDNYTSGTVGARGLALFEARYFTIRDSRFSGNGLEGAFANTSNDAVLFDGNYFYDNGKCDISGEANLAVEASPGARVVNNMFMGYAAGAYGETNCEIFFASDCLVSNNYSTAARWNGISIIRCSRTVVSNNIVTANGFNGINLLGQTVDTADDIVIGNMVYANTLDGILIETQAGIGIDRALIVGNICRANGGYGINVLGTAIDDTSIVANVLSGNTTGEFIDTGVNTSYAEVIGAYAPGSFTVPNGKFVMLTNRLQLTGTQRLRMSGTARLRLS